MPSLARKHQLQHSLLYHVYSRGCNRQVIFNQAEDFEHFKGLLRDYRERFQASIYHWVIMSNHYHLVIELKNPEIISKLMAGLHRSYSHYHHRAYATTGFLWQGRFKMQPIQKELYLVACGRYVERNPVRAGMVNQPYEYEHSSARYYCLGIFDNITSADPYFMGLSKNAQERQEHYRRLLLNFDSEEERHFTQFDSPCGNTEFVKRLILENGHLLPRRRGRR
jgi:putative transposase